LQPVQIDLELAGQPEHLEIVRHRSPQAVSIKYERAPPGPVQDLVASLSAPGYATVPTLRREGRSTATARLGLGVDEGEAPLQPLRHVVEGGAGEVQVALGVTHHRHSVQIELLVVLPELGVELEGVRQARAASALDPHAQEDILELLILEDLLDLHFC